MSYVVDVALTHFVVSEPGGDDPPMSRHPLSDVTVPTPSDARYERREMFIDEGVLLESLRFAEIIGFRLGGVAGYEPCGLKPPHFLDVQRALS